MGAVKSHACRADRAPTAALYDFCILRGALDLKRLAFGVLLLVIAGAAPSRATENENVQMALQLIAPETTTSLLKADVPWLTDPVVSRDETVRRLCGIIDDKPGAAAGALIPLLVRPLKALILQWADRRLQAEIAAHTAVYSDAILDKMFVGEDENRQIQWRCLRAVAYSREKDGTASVHFEFLLAFRHPDAVLGYDDADDRPPPLTSKSGMMMLWPVRLIVNKPRAKTSGDLSVSVNFGMTTFYPDSDQSIASRSEGPRPIATHTFDKGLFAGKCPDPSNDATDICWARAHYFDPLEGVRASQLAPMPYYAPQALSEIRLTISEASPTPAALRYLATAVSNARQRADARAHESIILAVTGLNSPEIVADFLGQAAADAFSAPSPSPSNSDRRAETEPPAQ